MGKNYYNNIKENLNLDAESIYVYDVVFIFHASILNKV
jgi:hypothetical protein